MKMNESAMIVVCGLMGTGKTTIATQLNKKLPTYTRFNTDDIRRLLGKTKFDPKDTPEVNSHIYFTMRFLLSESKGVISDSANKTKIVRERLYKIAREANAPIVVVECVAKDETSIKRISGRKKTDSLHSPTNDPKDYAEYKKLWEVTDNDMKDASNMDICFVKADTDSHTSKVYQKGNDSSVVDDILLKLNEVLDDLKQIK